MGNKPFRVALKLEQSSYVAGDVIKGSVYLSVDKQSRLQNLQGIYLLFEGVEHVEVTSHKPHDHRHQQQNHGSSGHSVDRSSVTLVRSDYPVVSASQLRVGQFEYPFQWRLPLDLPTSMRCTKNDTNNCAEIRYTLTAYLATSAGLRTSSASSNSGGLPRSELPLTIKSRARPSRAQNEPLLVETERFPVNTCLFWNNGHINMGWQANSDTATPNGEITLQVFGENESPVPVQHLKVKWLETVTWAIDPTQRKTVTRTLAKQVLAVDGLRCWSPWYNPGQPRTGDPSLYVCTAHLQLPADARDTYSGRLVQVRHVLVVKAHTDGCWITSPESSCQVRVVQKIASNSVLFDSQAVEQPIQIPEAQLLSTNWGPVVGEAVAIPEAQIVILDEELNSDELRRSFGTVVPQDVTPATEATVLIEPSAPPESLLDRGEEFHEGPVDLSQPPNVEQLRLLVLNSPEILDVVLQDSTWTSLVQDLSPRDFSLVVQSAGTSHGTAVARTLAQSMYPRLECRHLLACVWALPEEQRMDVLQSVAPLVSDLSTNQNFVEQELSPNELIHFRQSLQAAG